MSTTKRKPASANKTRQQLSDEIALFLKNGGEIQQISSGVSGQKNIPGPKHIVLSKQPDKRQ